MKLLILKAAYPVYLEHFYQRFPEVSLLDYSPQKEAFDQDGSWCGAGNPWRGPMASLGYEVQEVLFNARALQVKWAEENGVPVSDHWLTDIVTHQVLKFSPDVLFIQDFYPALRSEWIAQIRILCPSIRLVLGWRGAPAETSGWVKTLRAYDVTLSCVPELVASFQAKGLMAVHLDHAFDERVLSHIDRVCSKKIDISAVGLMYLANGFHYNRERLLKRLARECDIDIFCPSPMPPHSSLKRHLRPPVFGSDMFQTLHDSRIVFNAHIDLAVSRPSNMRLFEATGVGSCLLTDAKDGMSALFAPGRELVAYRSAEECVEKVRWLLTHPKDREEIALRGQERCLREHTYGQRAKELDKIIQSSLPLVGETSRPTLVHVLIPTYNRVELLKTTIQSIRAQSYRAVKVLVITGGDTDGTSAMLKEHFDDPDFLSELKVPHQVWWTEAMALGVAKVLQECHKEDLILSFNDDAVFTGYEDLSRMVDCCQRNKDAITVAANRDEEKDWYLSSGFTMDWANAKRIESITHCLQQGFPAELNLNAVYGRGALIPVKVFRQVGNYNAQDFVHYGGDAELSYRAWEAGWKCILLTRAVVNTSVKTTSGVSFWVTRNFVRHLFSGFLSVRSPYQITKGFKFIDRCCPSQYQLKNKVAYLKRSFSKVVLEHPSILALRNNSHPTHIKKPMIKLSSLRKNNAGAAPMTPQFPRELSGSLWGITSFFMPVKTDIKIENYHRFRDSTKNQGLKLLTVELAFDDEPFCLKADDADILVQIRGGSRHRLWQKEALLNIALQRLPADCDKVAWIDCDVIFKNDAWVNDVGELLEKYNVLQLFSRVAFLPSEQFDMDLDLLDQGQQEGRKMYGKVFNIVKAGAGAVEKAAYINAGHMGMAWAARREIIETVGFYDKAISGGGDSLIANAFLGTKCWLLKHLSWRLVEDYEGWSRQACDLVGRSVFYVEGDLLHLWHGALKDRLYNERHVCLREHGFDPLKDVGKDHEGVLAWVSAEHKKGLHAQVEAYFSLRKEGSCVTNLRVIDNVIVERQLK